MFDSKFNRKLFILSRAVSWPNSFFKKLPMTAVRRNSGGGRMLGEVVTFGMYFGIKTDVWL